MADGSHVAPIALRSDSDLLDAPLESVALQRLIEEVRSEDLDVARSYNRTYNRHNR